MTLTNGLMRGSAVFQPRARVALMDAKENDDSERHKRRPVMEYDLRQTGGDPHDEKPRHAHRRCEVAMSTQRHPEQKNDVRRHPVLQQKKKHQAEYSPTLERAEIDVVTVD